MSNVFGGSEKARVIKADKAIVTINGTVAIALGVSIQYTRQVQKVPVLALEDIISIGTASGVFSADTILLKGGSDIMANELISGDGCRPGTITVRFQDGACDSQVRPITCKNCIASAVNVTAQGGRGFVASGVSIIFTAMSFD